MSSGRDLEEGEEGELLPTAPQAVPAPREAPASRFGPSPAQPSTRDIRDIRQPARQQPPRGPSRPENWNAADRPRDRPGAAPAHEATAGPWGAFARPPPRRDTATPAFTARDTPQFPARDSFGSFPSRYRPGDREGEPSRSPAFSGHEPFRPRPGFRPRFDDSNSRPRFDDRVNDSEGRARFEDSRARFDERGGEPEGRPRFDDARPRFEGRPGEERPQLGDSRTRFDTHTRFDEHTRFDDHRIVEPDVRGQGPMMPRSFDKDRDMRRADAPAGKPPKDAQIEPPIRPGRSAGEFSRVPIIRDVRADAAIPSRSPEMPSRRFLAPPPVPGGPDFRERERDRDRMRESDRFLSRERDSRMLPRDRGVIDIRDARQERYRAPPSMSVPPPPRSSMMIGGVRDVRAVRPSMDRGFRDRTDMSYRPPMSAARGNMAEQLRAGSGRPGMTDKFRMMAPSSEERSRVRTDRTGPFLQTDDLLDDDASSTISSVDIQPALRVQLEVEGEDEEQSRQQDEQESMDEDDIGYRKRKAIQHFEDQQEKVQVEEVPQAAVLTAEDGTVIPAALAEQLVGHFMKPGSQGIAPALAAYLDTTALLAEAGFKEASGEAAPTVSFAEPLPLSITKERITSSMEAIDNASKANGDLLTQLEASLAQLKVTLEPKRALLEAERRRIAAIEEAAKAAQERRAAEQKRREEEHAKRQQVELARRTQQAEEALAKAAQQRECFFAQAASKVAEQDLELTATGLVEISQLWGTRNDEQAIASGITSLGLEKATAETLAFAVRMVCEWQLSPAHKALHRSSLNLLSQHQQEWRTALEMIFSGLQGFFSDVVAHSSERTCAFSMHLTDIGLTGSRTSAVIRVHDSPFSASLLHSSGGGGRSSLSIPGLSGSSAIFAWHVNINNARKTLYVSVTTSLHDHKVLVAAEAANVVPSVLRAKYHQLAKAGCSLTIPLPAVQWLNGALQRFARNTNELLLKNRGYSMLAHHGLVQTLSCIRFDRTNSPATEAMVAVPALARHKGRHKLLLADSTYPVRSIGDRSAELARPQAGVPEKPHVTFQVEVASSSSAANDSAVLSADARSVLDAYGTKDMGALLQVSTQLPRWIARLRHRVEGLTVQSVMDAKELHMENRNLVGAWIMFGRKQLRIRESAVASAFLLARDEWLMRNAAWAAARRSRIMAAKGSAESSMTPHPSPSPHPITTALSERTGKRAAAIAAKAAISATSTSAAGVKLLGAGDRTDFLPTDVDVDMDADMPSDDDEFSTGGRGGEKSLRLGGGAAGDLVRSEFELQQRLEIMADKERRETNRMYTTASLPECIPEPRRNRVFMWAENDNGRLTLDGGRQRCHDLPILQPCNALDTLNPFGREQPRQFERAFLGHCNCAVEVEIARKRVNPWSDAEKLIFMDKFMQYPKDFPKIASYLPNKTVSECIAFYYDTKHVAGYKYRLKAQINAQKRRSVRNGWLHACGAARDVGVTVHADIVRGVSAAGRIISAVSRVSDMQYSPLFVHPGPYARVHYLHRFCSLPMPVSVHGISAVTGAVTPAKILEEGSKSMGTEKGVVVRNDFIQGYGLGFNSLPWASRFGNVIADVDDPDPLTCAPTAPAAIAGAGAGVAASLVRVYLAGDSYTRSTLTKATDLASALKLWKAGVCTVPDASQLVPPSTLPMPGTLYGSISPGIAGTLRAMYPLPPVLAVVCTKVLLRLVSRLLDTGSQTDHSALAKYLVFDLLSTTGVSTVGVANLPLLRTLLNAERTTDWYDDSACFGLTWRLSYAVADVVPSCDSADLSETVLSVVATDAELAQLLNDAWNFLTDTLRRCLLGLANCVTLCQQQVPTEKSANKRMRMDTDALNGADLRRYFASSSWQSIKDTLSFAFSVIYANCLRQGVVTEAGEIARTDSAIQSPRTVKSGRRGTSIMDALDTALALQPQGLPGLSLTSGAVGLGSNLVASARFACAPLPYVTLRYFDPLGRSTIFSGKADIAGSLSGLELLLPGDNVKVGQKRLRTMLAEFQLSEPAPIRRTGYASSAEEDESYTEEKPSRQAPSRGGKRPRMSVVADTDSEEDADDDSESEEGTRRQGKMSSSAFVSKWTVEEKQSFLTGLQKYGRNWRKINAELLPGKTVPQIRNFFQNNKVRMGLIQILQARANGNGTGAQTSDGADDGQGREGDEDDSGSDDDN